MYCVIKAPRYRSRFQLLQRTISDPSLRREWCVEVEAGPSIVSAKTWKLDMEWGQDMPALQWHWEVL